MLCDFCESRGFLKLDIFKSGQTEYKVHCLSLGGLFKFLTPLYILKSHAPKQVPAKSSKFLQNQTEYLQNKQRNKQNKTRQASLDLSVQLAKPSCSLSLLPVLLQLWRAMKSPLVSHEMAQLLGRCCQSLAFCLCTQSVCNMQMLFLFQWGKPSDHCICNFFYFQQKQMTSLMSFQVWLFRCKNIL